MLIKSNFQLPTNVHSSCLSWLTRSEVCKTAVCKRWLVKSECETFWKSECIKMNLTLDSIGTVIYGIEMVVGRYFSEGIAPADSKKSRKIVKLIAEYAPDCMHKLKATILTADAVFHEHVSHIKVFPKVSNIIAKPWGVYEDEPLINVQKKVQTNEDITKWVTRKFLLENSAIERDMDKWDAANFEEFWAFCCKYPEIPLPDAIKNLPTHMPLKCFFDRQGNFKTEGDPIHLIFKGRKVILLCKHQPVNSEKQRPFSFVQGLEQRIFISNRDGFINGQTVERAKELAKTIPEWLSPDNY